MRWSRRGIAMIWFLFHLSSISSKKNKPSNRKTKLCLRLTPISFLPRYQMNSEIDHFCISFQFQTLRKFDRTAASASTAPKEDKKSKIEKMKMITLLMELKQKNSFILIVQSTKFMTFKVFPWIRILSFSGTQERFGSCTLQLKDWAKSESTLTRMNRRLTSSELVPAVTKAE